MNLDLLILLAYQAWCGEAVKTPERAETIIYDLREMLRDYTSKKYAVNALQDADWTDSPTNAKRLVDSIWHLREKVVNDSILPC